MNAVLATSSSWPYVGAAWGVSAGVLGWYVVALLRRAKRLSGQVPPESRRWM